MIIGLGLVNKDIVAVVPSWERDAKVAATRLFEQVGGPVPVALATMARLGSAALAFLGVVGGDANGDDVLRRLAEEGVDCRAMERAEGVATSVSLCLIDARDGSRALANYAEELPPLSLTPERIALLEKARLVHLDGRDLPASLEAARIVRAAGGLVSLDLGTMRPGREALFPLCDVLIASHKGGAGAFPEVAADPMEQVRRFLAAGVCGVAGVTLGEAGVVIGEHGRSPIHLQAHAVRNVLDTNGAGDVFHGAFLHAFLETGDALHAAHFAQAAAAHRIRFSGNREGLPTALDLEITAI
jgi:sulfofructose kinase